jgi:YggT family protein
MFSNSLSYLIYGIGSAVAFIFLLRVMVQLGQVDFYNPLCQFCYKLTNPILRPLRKFPRYKRLDVLALTAFMLSIAAMQTLLLLVNGAEINAITFVMRWLVSCIDWLYWFLFVCIIIGLLASFIQGFRRHDFAEAAQDMLAPFLWPIRKFVPVFGVVDFSPIVLFFALTLLRLLLMDAFLALDQAI